MDITLTELLKGKATKIKDKAYYQTEAYVNPFLNRLVKIPGVSEDNIQVKVELPEQITITNTKNHLLKHSTWVVTV